MIKNRKKAISNAQVSLPPYMHYLKTLKQDSIEKIIHHQSRLNSATPVEYSFRPVRLIQLVLSWSPTDSSWFSWVKFNWNCFLIKEKQVVFILMPHPTHTLVGGTPFTLWYILDDKQSYLILWSSNLYSSVDWI